MRLEPSRADASNGRITTITLAGEVLSEMEMAIVGLRVQGSESRAQGSGTWGIRFGDVWG